MRALIDATYAAHGGLATYARALASAWRNAGDIDGVFIVPEDFDLDGDVDRVTIRGVVGQLSRLAAGQRRIPKIVQMTSPDVFYSLLPILPGRGIRVAKAVLAHDLRHDLRPHEFSRMRRAARRVSYRHAYRHADLIITISNRTRDDLETLYPKTRGRTLTILSGADHVQARHPARPKHEYALTFAHHPNKNPAGVVLAIADLAKSGLAIPLRVIGCSPDVSLRLQQLARELGIVEYVTTAGPLPPFEYENTFAACSLVILNSTFEGFGLPVLEALRMGIPCATSPDPAMREVGGPHISSAADWSTLALSQAIRQAWSRRNDLERVAKGRLHAANFTWHRTALETQRALARLINSR